MKKINKKQLAVFGFMAAFALILMVFSPESASAATNSDAWSKAGISPNGNIKNNGVFEDLNTLVWLVMAVGGFWVILWIVIGGMLLSGSNGNPQRRTAGLVSLACSAGGGWVIYKCYDIAGYIAGFGA
ncbi:hypothetical protein [Metabacillus halosaccharovorans]|uniref:hypothetical protein n=1 Tax=Metabacillus halosaccharovorans TaxID=930124 RepID=UPI000C7F978D|nr:hypothetical protein [Metabacillus halosaccharovorans]MBU7595920.1 hypothetical protein [Metabacillus halosaccharovorans]PMC36230.1 hypothetical protein CJ195_15565 [Bacillus sp. UMB0899]